MGIATGAERLRRPAFGAWWRLGPIGDQDLVGGEAVQHVSGAAAVVRVRPFVGGCDFLQPRQISRDQRYRPLWHTEANSGACPLAVLAEAGLHVRIHSGATGSHSIDQSCAVRTRMQTSIEYIRRESLS